MIHDVVIELLKRVDALEKAMDCQRTFNTVLARHETEPENFSLKGKVVTDLEIVEYVNKRAAGNLFYNKQWIDAAKSEILRRMSKFSFFCQDEIEQIINEVLDDS